MLQTDLHNPRARGRAEIVFSEKSDFSRRRASSEDPRRGRGAVATRLLEAAPPRKIHVAAAAPPRPASAEAAPPRKIHVAAAAPPRPASAEGLHRIETSQVRPKISEADFVQSLQRTIVGAARPAAPARELYRAIKARPLGARGGGAAAAADASETARERPASLLVSAAVVGAVLAVLVAGDWALAIDRPRSMPVRCFGVFVLVCVLIFWVLVIGLAAAA